MEVYLIRHTTPEAAKGLIYGRTDIPLADTFEQEKNAILKKLAFPLHAVYSSPAKRCSLLAQQISPQFVIDERLYEVNFGKWEGRTWDDIDFEESKAWMEDYVNICPPDGESMVQMNERVQSFWNELQMKPFERVAVVTHGGVIRLLLAAVCNLPLKSIFNIEVEMGQVFLLSPRHNNWILKDNKTL